MISNNLLGSLTKGMVAGFVGTTAMTVSERLEMAVTGRQGSTVPGQVGAHLLPGQDPKSTTDIERLNTPVHWAHGIIMGALRGAIHEAGLQGLPASAAHFALFWGGDAALYRALGIADVPWRWEADELTSDLLHKAVYAAVTGAVYDAMTADSH
ncbi:hypothetical protein IWX75_003403 [Arthrobacter sp. CAN_A6]|uniref:hypothetical protein n=1 Tax=Arthrobacter sp. CAN_A6 TaxID=2787721 RepID=UPI0018CA8AEC